jgi:hypothetical protein
MRSFRFAGPIAKKELKKISAAHTNALMMKKLINPIDLYRPERIAIKRMSSPDRRLDEDLSDCYIKHAVAMERLGNCPDGCVEKELCMRECRKIAERLRHICFLKDLKDGTGIEDNVESDGARRDGQ